MERRRVALVSVSMNDKLWPEFVSAPVWAEEVEAFPHDRAVYFTTPAHPDADESRLRYYHPAGRALALLARQNGATSPADVRLEIGLEDDGSVVRVKPVIRQSK